MAGILCRVLHEAQQPGSIPFSRHWGNLYTSGTMDWREARAWGLAPHEEGIKN